MALSRRDLLKLGIAGALHPLLPVRGIVSKVFAAPGAANAKFLLVFLRGGYDAANVVIPIGSDFYYEVRPTLALPKPDRTRPDAALSLAGPSDAAIWGLHPALGRSMLPLWGSRQVAFVPFAGTADLTRSHFETQDSIESGMPVASGPSNRSYGSGFLNRLAAALDGRSAPVAFTDTLPVVLSGPIAVPNVSLKGAARTPFDNRQMSLLVGMYAGTPFDTRIAEGFELRKTVAEEAEQASAEMQAANRNAITAQGFELEATRMAGLMRDRFDIGFIDVGGWDTHVNQGAAQGQLATLLTSLGQGLASFQVGMGSAWDRTVVYVLSEFGRTFRENGTRGTDHGHGSVHWVLGGAVHGGRFVGEQIPVTPAALNQNRDYPVLTDYRSLLAGLFRRMYQLDATRLAEVFQEAAALELGLV